jgi:hypothetical protein
MKDKNPRKIILFVTRVDQVPLTGDEVKKGTQVQIACQGSLRRLTKEQIRKALEDNKFIVTEQRNVLG